MGKRDARFNENFIARPGKTKSQLLGAHLLGVSELAGEYCEKLGLKLVGRLLGLLHDLGKYGQSFQEYIHSLAELIKDFDIDDVEVRKTDKKKLIDHSTAGAQWIWDRWRNRGDWQGRISAQITSICLASHHSGLIDVYDKDSEYALKKRIEKDRTLTSFDEALERFEFLEEAEALCIPALKELTNKLKEIRDNPNLKEEKHRNTKDFYYGLLTKMIFSCILDADRTNSAEWENIPLRSKEPPSWETLTDNINKLFVDVNKTPLNTLRSEVSDLCWERAMDKQGVYRLTVPTGGGKTFASLRFAARHAQKYNLRRIIYVIPYTSIIEQNADTVRDKLKIGDEWILEQHSNIVPEKHTYRNKILANSWDAPIIFTTMFQFLSVLFSREPRYARRMHNLAKSVIIFDEVQALPVRCAHIFSNAINFLAEHADCSALLCTATQPLLDKIAPERGSIRILCEIIPNVNKLFDDLKRVEFHNLLGQGKLTGEEIARLAKKEFEITERVLIIANTKKSAKKLYNLLLEKDGDSIFHLSASMCAAHRSRVIAKIKERLGKKPVLCVSTQLIEAGVDIDFDVVIKFFAGLDSIMQAAGRSNREMRDGVVGKVYIVAADENIEPLADIKEGQTASGGVLKDCAKDTITPDDINRYFESYFFNRQREMSYSIGGSYSGITLSALLGSNGCSVDTGAGEDYPLLKQSFKRAGEEFKVFDEKNYHIIVPYEEGEEIIAELCAIDPDKDAKKFYAALMKAQRYTVDLFENEYKKIEKALIPIGNTGLVYLKKEYYHDKLGVIFE